ncbi:LysR family transcriptional regulator [Hydrogenophaga sp.]|uniref:LysR family transcriptional regulator n=1 Tax=Hydrogenophaga sp. TaxID=1904254 RepID=UPI002731772D|nr:LysR family transcriptional regulator [Hydrogenophaga sp.]MDP2016416.1 LysR substrate-binding domain-containing protein [Hydrogenophaga sp.]MDP3166173.1 LysR substrate-binding domain-containing protein [Hydrogenophaga sp.]MDP3812328.1 LysR substrate-binding domain-containing protein [Hydrogenophaga sp.]
MNFIWLEDFLALASSGNFSRAAEERHTSQPAFSRRIRALEEWLGAALFDRSSQPARLTDVGEWFVGVANDLINRVERVPGEARQVAEASSVTLRIASTHALSFTFLPRWLRGLESQTTLGPVQLMSDVLQRCEALMLQGQVQFVLSHAHSKAQGALDAEPYRSARIGEDQLVAVSAPDAHGHPKHQLGGSRSTAVQVLKYTEESGLGRITRAVLDRRLEAFAVQVVFTAHLASVLRTMVLDARGLAWLPQTLVQEDLDQGRLVAAASSDWNVPLEIRLYRDRELRGRAADAFWKTAAGV